MKEKESMNERRLERILQVYIILEHELDCKGLHDFVQPNRWAKSLRSGKQ